MNEIVPTTVIIMGKEYRISCPQEEQEALITSAQFLDGKMKEIRQAGRVIGVERIAVMAALNITHELLQKEQTNEPENGHSTVKVQALDNKLKSAIANFQN